MPHSWLLRVGACWSRNSGNLQKKSTERVLFFVYSLLLSTDLPGTGCRCAVGAAPAQPLPAPPRVRPGSEDKEALSAALPRTWFQGVPTDQFDPGLNKEQCVWIRNPRCVLLFPPCSRPCVPSGPGRSPSPREEPCRPSPPPASVSRPHLPEWGAGGLVPAVDPGSQGSVATRRMPRERCLDGSQWVGTIPWPAGGGMVAPSS